MRAILRHNGLWGVCALTLFAGLLVFLYTPPNQDEGYWHLEANFRNVGDLKEGAPVMMSGMTVGSVKSIHLLPNLDVRVRIKLMPNLQVPEDSDLRIQTASLFGTPNLSLLLGGGFDLLEDGDEFSFTQSSVDFLHLLQQIVESATEKPSST